MSLCILGYVPFLLLARPFVCTPVGSLFRSPLVPYCCRQMSQAERLEALNKFKSGYIKTLVATDVASRGIDIPTVRYVINFNVPKAVEDYIHRSGARFCVL